MPRRKSTSEVVALPKDWEAKLQEFVERDKAATTSSVGNFISTRNGKFSYGGSDLGTELSVVILGAVRSKMYYRQAFDPNNPAGVACYALGYDQNTMAPPNDVPAKQSDSCATCPMNVFGTDERGRGKACRDTVRLAVASVSKSEPDSKDIDKAEVAMLSVPPTSLKRLGEYQRVIGAQRRPLWAATTLISIEKDNNTMWAMHFKTESLLNDSATLLACMQRSHSVRDLLFTPPQLETSEEGATRVVAGERRRKVVRKAK